MFSAIASITAVCVALAVSGWNPAEIPTFSDDPTGLALLNADTDCFSDRIDHVLSMVTDLADWILFYGDRALTDIHYPHLQMCECGGTFDHQGTFYTSRVWRKEEDPNRMHIVYQVFQQTPEMVLRLSAAIGMIPTDHVTAQWSNENSLFPKFSPSVYLPRRRRTDWRKFTLDIRHLLLAFILHFAIKGFKGWCYGKKTTTKIDCGAEKEPKGTEPDKLALFPSPTVVVHCGDSPSTKDFSATKPVFAEEAPPDKLPQRRYISTNPHGFGKSWYKIVAVQKTTTAE